MNPTPLTDAERVRIAQIFSKVPFVQHLGLTLVEVERGRAVVGATARPEYLQNHGVLHGGFTASVIDTATAFAIIGHLAPGETTTTVDLTIHYLRPITAGQLSATAKVIRAGRRIISAVAEVTDASGQLCAMASTTYIRINGESPAGAADSGS
jgi:uncharacterized protein (TIGR00369 family)